MPIALPASSLLAEQALEQAVLEMQSANRPAASVPVGIAETPQLVNTAAPVPVGIMVMPQLANTGDRNIGPLATTGNGAVILDQVARAYANGESRVANIAPTTGTQSSADGGESGPRSTAIPMTDPPHIGDASGIGTSVAGVAGATPIMPIGYRKGYRSTSPRVTYGPHGLSDRGHGQEGETRAARARDGGPLPPGAMTRERSSTSRTRTITGTE